MVFKFQLKKILKILKDGITLLKKLTLLNISEEVAVVISRR